MAAVDNVFLGILKIQISDMPMSPPMKWLSISTVNTVSSPLKTSVRIASNRIKEDYDSVTSMVSFFYSTRNICNIATRAGNPISESDLITELYLVMEQAGIFTKAIDDWDKLPAANQTWQHFQTHFKVAYRCCREKQCRTQASNGGVKQNSYSQCCDGEHCLITWSQFGAICKCSSNRYGSNGESNNCQCNPSQNKCWIDNKDHEPVFRWNYKIAKRSESD